MESQNAPPAYWQTVDGALVIRATALFTAMAAAAQQGQGGRLAELQDQVRTQVEPAKGVVIDARADEADNAGGYLFELFRRNLMAALIDRTVPLGTWRRRPGSARRRPARGR